MDATAAAAATRPQAVAPGSAAEVDADQAAEGAKVLSVAEQRAVRRRQKQAMRPKPCATPHLCAAAGGAHPGRCQRARRCSMPSHRLQTVRSERAPAVAGKNK
jgi:hypothetical protein